MFHHNERNSKLENVPMVSRVKYLLIIIKVISLIIKEPRNRDIII